MKMYFQRNENTIKSLVKVDAMDCSVKKERSNSRCLPNIFKKSKDEEKNEKKDKNESLKSKGRKKLK